MSAVTTDNSKIFLQQVPVAFAGFFNGGISVTSHHDDVKILRNTTSSRCDVTGNVNLDF